MNNKKAILLFCFLFVLGCSVETKKELYPSGKVKAEKRYKKGKLEGITKEFYESGKLKAKIYYKDDKPMPHQHAMMNRKISFPVHSSSSLSGLDDDLTSGELV